MEVKENTISIFNPLINKSPVGAIKCEENITMEVLFPSHFNIYDLKLIIVDDYGNTYKELPFSNSIKFKMDNVGLYWYYFMFNDCYGTHYLIPDESLDGIISNEVSSKWLLSVYTNIDRHVKWFNGSTMYQIFPDRFAIGDKVHNKDYGIYHNNWNDLPLHGLHNGEWNIDFFGGNIKGITSKLHYLKSLNIKVIYLNPILLARSNHRYDTSNYLEIDPILGTEEDFKELCVRAKKVGIKIILDMVFNHTGDDSIYFNKYHHFDSLGAYESENSPYRGLYEFGSEFKNGYRSWWDIPIHPALNQNDPSYLPLLDSVLRKWISLGASGIRLDVVDELNDETVKAIRRSAKETNPQAIIIGEVWENAATKIAYGSRRHYFSGEELDSVMNYEFMKAIIKYTKDNDYLNLRNVIRNIINDYPKYVLDNLMNIMDTHDTIRLVNNFYNNIPKTVEEKRDYIPTIDEKEEAIRKMKRSVVLQFTLPGVPSIYYGDEVGVDGFDDPYNRKTYPWGNENIDLLDFYKDLSNIRKDNVFTDGIYKEYIINDSIYSFTREKDGEEVLVIINNSDKEYKEKKKGFDMFANIETNIQVSPYGYGVYKTKSALK